MKHFIEALETSLKTKNWYSSLFIVLSAPDICGKIDEPEANSKQRSINWYNKYIKQYYTMKIGPKEIEYTFLGGSDFYALRCAYLHEGTDDISSQRAREALEKFQFTQPTNNAFSAHMMQSGTKLQLQVDKFGEDMLKGLKAWMKDATTDPVKLQKIESLLNIQILDPKQGFNI